MNNGNVPAQPIYVSGPMTGYPDFNRRVFGAACAALRDMGYDIISPHEVVEEPGMTWADYVRKDLVLLVAARSVVVLPGWECSRGACLEVHVAHALGMHVFPLQLVAPSRLTT